MAAQPGHQEHVQALSSPEVTLASAMCVALSLLAFSCTGTLVPSEAAPHQVGLNDDHSFNFLPQTPREGRVLNPSAVSHTPALLRETHLERLLQLVGAGDRAV